MPSRPWRPALAWLALLGPLFFASYGFANWAAAQRAPVPSIVFDWERSIPFVAWTIVPYWSIDLLYALSLFVCRSRQELDVHVRRLLSAQLISVFCFLLWPLSFSFQRPPTSGVFGWMFDVLLGFDKPYNQAPSLHIVLLVVLWVRYARHLHGVWRWLLHGWFALIGLSVLTTYQHHFLDVPTGLAVGWLCVWLWPEAATSPLAGASWARERRRWALAGLYLAGAAIFALLAAIGRGVAWWLLWPTLSLLLVAANYAGFGAAGFQKRADGRLSTAARWLYAPYLLAAWLNSRIWTRKVPAPVEIVDGVWLGRMPCYGEREGFVRVVDVSAEMSRPGARAGDVCVPMLDLVVPPPALLRAAANAVDEGRKRGAVLVCCALGYSRSAAVVATWLCTRGRAIDAAAAVEIIRRRKPSVHLNASLIGAVAAAVDADTDAHSKTMQVPA